MIETNHSITPLSPQFRASISMAVRVLAQRSAVEIVKHQLRARGLKVYSFAHREIVAVAHDYIAAHAELIAEATVTVEERRPGFFGKRAARTGHILGQSATTPANRARFLNDHSPSARAKGAVMRPVRRPNAEYRVREHLTETEIEKLLAAQA